MAERLPPDVAAMTASAYEARARREGDLRHSLLANREVLFQVVAQDVALVRAMQRIAFDPARDRVLDVGCGDGMNFMHFLRLGSSPEHLVGVDILPERIAKARRWMPSVRFIEGDATRLDLESASFDVVTELTMFVAVTDEPVARAVAREMVRVCKPGGHLVLLDWRTPKPWDPATRALTRSRLRALFAVGDATERVDTIPAALVPPVGRFLSRRLPSVYQPVARLFPFLVGQVAYVLRRRG